MTVTHSKMLKTRRKHQKNQKVLAREAKIVKKDAKQGAKAGGSAAPKASGQS